MAKTAGKKKRIRIRLRFSFAADEIDQVVARLDEILRKPVPLAHREAVGLALLTAVEVLKSINLGLRKHGKNNADVQNKMQRNAAKLASQMLEILGDPSIKANCVEELYQRRLEGMTGTERMPFHSVARLEENKLLEKARDSLEPELDRYFDSMVVAVDELNDLLRSIPAVRGLRKKSPPITHWRQDITSELARAYEQIYERSPDQGRDWVSLVKFVHERAGLACEDELARTFSPAWQAVHRASV